MSNWRVFEFGPFRVDARERLVRRNGAPVPLTPKAFDTLQVLLRHRGRLVTKQELIHEVWPGTFVEEGSLTFNISALRKALGQGRNAAAYIETVPRHGYRFIGAARETGPSSHPPIRQSVGRSREREEIRAAFEAVRVGPGRLLCVTGEPGIGKTTVIEGFLEDAARADATSRIGRGRCSERLGGTGAYLPVLEALDSLCAGPGGAEIAGVLRTTASNWYAELWPRGIRSAPVAAPTQERLKWELLAFVRAVGGVHPVILFVDDLHWADPSTVDLLAYLADRFESMHLLVLTAYRSSELLTGHHPFAALKLDLEGRGRCQELPLALLSREDIDAYLSLAFPHHQFPETFAAAIHATTNGNALFMSDLLRELRDRGVLAAAAGGWTLARPVPLLERELPQSIRSVIKRTLERLDPIDRALLTAASVQGDEFHVSAIAPAAGLEIADAEDRLDALERTHGLLKREREQELPDHTLSVRYRFVHVLYQDALYGSLTPGRKMALSGAVAAALVAHYGERLAERASEVAELLSVAREFARAADTFLVAAQHALRLFAHQEAIALARRGLAMLEAAPEVSDRDRVELLLQTVLGVSLMAVEGFGAPDAERAYRRASVLCQTARHQQSFFPVLSGLWLYYTIRGELRHARVLAARMLDLAQRHPDATLSVQAHQAAGGTFMDEGRFDDALEHFDHGRRKYRLRRRKHFDLHAIDPGVACLAFAGRVLGPRGYPDRARERAREAVALARTLQHPHSLSIALGFAATVHDFCGEIARTLELTEEAAALSRDHGLVQTLGWAQIWRGRALVRHGRTQDGVAEMREGLRASRAMGSRISSPQFLALLAEALGDEGYVDEGLALLADALAVIRATDERAWEAEVHRLRGRLLARRSPGARREAEASVQRALGRARAQNAKGWELRAAVELCLLRQDRRTAAAAHAGLERVYAWFTEGFDTADLRAAAALLERRPA